MGVRYKHKECGKFVKQKENSTGQDYYFCLHCMLSTDEEDKIEEIRV